MKRAFDLLASFAGLIIFTPILILFCILIWINDFHSPFYIAPRVGKNGKIFKMIKFRSMVLNADKCGVDSTSSSDKRITPVGKIIRKFKLDELIQLWNVFIGDMSLVGPRPNVERETRLYSYLENITLSIKPGITDFSSIIFSDEGEILKGKKDPDLAYNQLIRPGKSALGIFYVKNKTFFLDIKLILITIISLFSRSYALRLNTKLLRRLGAEENLINLSRRLNPLKPEPPPGFTSVVQNR